MPSDRTTDAKQFAVKFRERLAIIGDQPAYSIPHDLIRILNRCFPRLLKPEDEQFERNLAELADLCFWRGRFINAAGHGGIHRSLQHWASSAEQAMARSSKQTNRKPTLAASLRLRHDAYFGWLLQSKDFWSDLKKVRVQVKGKVPELVTQVRAETIVRNAGSGRHAYVAFCQRWGLAGMATWDWPIIAEPTLVDSSGPPSHTVGGLFLPWHVFRGGTLNFEELRRKLAREGCPEPIRTWAMSQKKGHNWGDKGLASGAALYRYVELPLQRRYPERLHRNLDRLDVALAEYLLGSHLHRETLRKARQQLARSGQFERGTYSLASAISQRQSRR